ncbi:hypothetical protein ACFU99_03855 [Streptomyces sp. NPDC057654]|uniref:hypothetical protein n=1 Tax=Streptomyces sp. NPDC057654 TaxID=3346196 RepID=UPI0036AEA12E
MYLPLLAAPLAPTVNGVSCPRPLPVAEDDAAASDDISVAACSITVDWDDPAPVTATVPASPLWCEHRTGPDEPTAGQFGGGHWSASTTTALRWLTSSIGQAARTLPLPPAQAILLTLLVTGPTANHAHHYALRFRQMTLSVTLRAHGRCSTWTISHQPLATVDHTQL